MNRARIEILAGVFVLAGIVILTYFAVSLGGVSLKKPASYELEARFTNIAGVNVGSQVRIAGVPVGEVTAIRLDREQMVAILTMKLPAEIELFDDTIAAVRTNGLIGDKVVTLLPGGSGIPLEPGDLIVDTESAIDIEGLIKKFAFGDVENQ
jgi:phospholipid/cholesterol/gamma-HCH transport system substrate-binding protein